YLEHHSLRVKDYMIQTNQKKTYFFQAEDGIRDWSVTGVQTCALPICDGIGLRRFAGALWAWASAFIYLRPLARGGRTYEHRTAPFAGMRRARTVPAPTAGPLSCWRNAATEHSKRAVDDFDAQSSLCLGQELRAHSHGLERQRDGCCISQTGNL